MTEVIRLGQYWGYTSKQCDGCPHLEQSSPDEDGKTLVACGAPNGVCVKNGEQIYE